MQYRGYIPRNIGYSESEAAASLMREPDPADTGEPDPADTGKAAAIPHLVGTGAMQTLPSRLDRKLDYITGRVDKITP